MGLLAIDRGQRRFDHRILKWALLSTLVLPYPAAAQLYTWTNPGEGDWQSASNWNPSGVPAAFSTVRIDNGGTAIIDTIAADIGSLFVNGATLLVRNGGTLETTDVSLASVAGSVTTVIVDGPGSRWSNKGILPIFSLATGGEGSITISNGGVVEGEYVAVASGNGSKGTLTVTGPGSQFTARDMDVSRGSGAGAIDVRAKGAMTLTQSLSIGYDAGAVGTVTVSGTGSSLTVGQIFRLGAGLGATGTLTLGDSATVTVNGGAGAIETGTGGGGGRGIIHIGAAPASAAVAPGVLDVAAVNTSAGSEINFNHTDTNYNFMPQINGGTAVRIFSGTTALARANTYAGGTFLNGGTLSVADDANLGDAAGAITIDGGTLQINGTGFTSTARTINWGPAGGGFVIANAANRFTVSQPLAGGALVKQGLGTLVLTGENTYSGGTTISGGVLQIGNGGDTGSIIGNVINNGTLTVTRTGTLVLDGVISGSGRFNQTSTGTTILAADNTYTGDTTISAGTLQVGSGGASGSIAGAIANNGTLAIDRTGILVLSGPLSGNGTLRQTGTGTTILSGDASAFAGSTVVEHGTLRVGSVLGGSVTVAAGGTLGGAGVVQGAVTVNGTLSAGASPGTLVVGTLTLNSGSTSFFELNAPGVVGGTNNDLIIVNGDLTLGGTLTGQAAAGGFYRLYNYGGTLSGAFATANITGTGGFTVANQQVQTSIPGQVNLAVIGSGQRLQFWDGADSIGNGTIDGGAGTWSSTGTNWTGVPGQAEINGPWGGSIAVFAGAAGGTVTVSGTQAIDTLQVTTNGYVLSGGSLALSPASGTATLNVDSGITAAISSIITDGTATDLNKIGGGTLVLTGANIYSGATAIGAGILRIGAGGSIASSSAVTLSADGTTLEIAADAGDQIVRNLSGAAGSRVGLNRNLTVNATADTTFAGTISGDGGLGKTGGRTLTLTGTNTYTGTTTISTGTLSLGAGGSIAKSSVVSVGASGTLSIADGGNQTVQTLSGAPGAKVVLGANTLTVGTDADATFAGVISGSGGVIKNGTGTWTLTVINSYTGTTTVNAGTLQLSGSGTIPASSAVTLNAAGATLDIAQSNGPRFVQNLSGAAGSKVILGANTLSAASSTNTGFAGAISGDGGLNKVGVGILTLAGANTYTGATSIFEGTLALAAAGSIAASSAVTLGNANATLAATGGPQTVQNLGGVAGSTVTLTASMLTVASATNTTFAGAIEGDGGLVKTGPGTLTLTGPNTYRGGTTISIGTLQLGDGGATGSIVGNIGIDGTLAINRTGVLALDGAVSGTGALRQAGDGTTILSGDGSAFAGMTTVDRGILRVDGRLGSSLVVSKSGTLGGGGTIAGSVTVDGTLSAGASPGTLTAGTLTLNSGSTSLFELNAPGVVGGTSNDLVVVNGDLALAGTLDARAAAGGYYRLFNYGGTLSGAFATTNVSGAGGFTVAGQQLQTSIPGQVNLAVVGTGQMLQFWDGGDSIGNGSVDGGAGTWSGTDTNWTGQPGQAEINGAWGGSVAVFAGAAGGAVTVSGTLAFDTAQFSTNGYTLTGGTLALSPASGTAGTITVDSSITATVGTVIADGTATTLRKVGSGTLVLTGTSTYSGGTIISAGTLQLGDGGTTGSITGNIINDGMLAFDRSDVVAFGSIVSGTGGVRQSGSGTTILAGTNTYSGPTTVENGRLVVNGGIAHSVVTVTNGTLGGIGTVGGVIASRGGTVAPGNSIGTLTVSGNVSFAAGSTYEVDIEPSGASDTIHATGTATLSGGTVSVIKATGRYTGGRRYTILTADGGVTGTFAGLTQSRPFVDLALTYDPSNVFLLVTRNAVSFCSLAGSANQCEAANSAERLGAGNPLYDALASLPDAMSARQAFNALSGELHASTKSALIEDSHYLRDAIITRARLSGLSSAPTPQFAALAQATDQNQRPQDGTAITAWFQGFGALARASGDGNAGSAKRASGGFFIGADTKLADTWTVGLATGYSRTTVDVDGRSSRASIDSYHLALYGGAQLGSLGLRLGASHTWHRIDSSRSITFPGLADAARADYDARTAQIFGDVGYGLVLGNAALETFANLAWVHLSTDRIGERGGIAALRSRGGSDSNLFSTLGVRAAAHVWNDDSRTLTLRGTLGWRHAFGDMTPAARLAFANGTSFGVEGVPIARDSAVIEAGFDLKVGKAFTIGAGYAGVIASGAHDHAFKGNLTYRF